VRLTPAVYRRLRRGPSGRDPEAGISGFAGRRWLVLSRTSPPGPLSIDGEGEHVGQALRRLGESANRYLSY
jgi:hypothetical protein